LKVFAVVSSVVVTSQASLPALFDADALDTRLLLGILRVLDVSSPRTVARLAPVLGDRIEALVGCSCQRVFVAGVTPGAHLVADIRIQLLGEEKCCSSRLRERRRAETEREKPREQNASHSDASEPGARTNERRETTKRTIPAPMSVHPSPANTMNPSGWWSPNNERSSTTRPARINRIDQ
jgi:hypothetical protein